MNTDSLFKKALSSPAATATTTTTTTLSRVCGFTVELLFRLKDRPVRTKDLVDSTGKESHYVRKYLSNMRKYGLVARNNPFWSLTDEGNSFLSYLTTTTTTTTIRERKEKDRRKIGESSEPKKLKQASLKPFLDESGLDRTERVVVEVLVKHYQETGGKFLYADDNYGLADRLGVDAELLGPALRKLIEDNIIYIYPSRGQGVRKVGLKKAFLERLNALEKLSKS